MPTAEDENLKVFYRTLTTEQLRTYHAALTTDAHAARRQRHPRTEAFAEHRRRLIAEVLQERGEEATTYMTSPAPEAVARYPLEWPAGWVRTPSYKRTKGDFRQTKHDVVTTPTGPQRTTRSTAVTIFVATGRLERQLDLLRATNPVLSTNISLRLDGRPRSDEEPKDPGAAVYFRFKGKATVLACDRYVRVADNIAAIANHIDALRRIERYGVGTIEQALAGYKALPADTAADWRAVFGFARDVRVSVEQVQSAYKERARKAHPDFGGTDDAMAHINRARDYALAELTH